MIVFSVQGFIFDFLNLEFLSSNAVLADLPAMIRGEMGSWEQWRIALAFGAASLGLAAIAGLVFDQREF
jgi:hypothetical protein